MRVVYLHGFASSAQSSKARFFAEQLAPHGIPFAAPDLNAPDFSTLTISRMLRQTAAVIDGADTPVALIGSSLGGFVAVQAAVRDPGRVQRVVLLAPALEFDGARVGELGGVSLEAWKAANRLDVFHYGYGRMMPLHYDLYADSRRYDPQSAQLTQPVQVFQGRHDVAVDPESVARWAAARPNVELHLLDDDHQLHASLDYIWRTLAGWILA